MTSARAYEFQFADFWSYKIIGLVVQMIFIWANDSWFVMNLCIVAFILDTLNAVVSSTLYNWKSLIGNKMMKNLLDPHANKLFVWFYTEFTTHSIGLYRVVCIAFLDRQKYLVQTYIIRNIAMIWWIYKQIVT